MNLSSKFPLFAVLILLISTGCTDNPYRDEDTENQIASYGVLVHPMTNNHSAAPGYDTDFILTVWNIGSETATFKIEVTHKDEGIEKVSFEQNMNNMTILADSVLPLIVNVNLSSSATGVLRTDIEFSSESKALIGSRKLKDWLLRPVMKTFLPSNKFSLKILSDIINQNEKTIKLLNIDIKLAKKDSVYWETAYNNKKTFSLFKTDSHN